MSAEVICGIFFGSALDATYEVCQEPRNALTFLYTHTDYKQTDHRGGWLSLVAI